MTTPPLRGPADPDHYRVKVGRFRERWYCDPLPADPKHPATDQTWPSISAVKPPFANSYVAMRRCADMDDTEWQRLAGVDADRRYDAIKSHDRAVGRVAMDRGSIVHAWAEDLIAGRQPQMPLPTEAVTEAQRFLPALQAFFDDWQPAPVAVETVAINRHLNGFGYGGTLDLIAEIGGGAYVIDWKTRSGDHAAYLEEAAQVAGYGLADYLIADRGDGPHRMAVPDLAGGLIVSIRPDGYRIFPVDLYAARDAFERMHAWWAAQRSHDSVGNPWPPRTITAAEPAKAEARPETSSSPSRFGSGLSARIGELRTRLSIIVEFTDITKDRLAAEWPFNAPALTDAHHHEHTDETLDALDRWVTGLEKQHRIEVADTAEYIERIEALPEDIRSQLAAEAKAIGTPNLRTGRVTLRELDRLEPLIYSAEKAAKQRLTAVVDALTPLPEPHADSIVQWATEDRPEPLQTADGHNLAQLTGTEADTAIELAQRYQRPPTEEETA